MSSFYNGLSRYFNASERKIIRSLKIGIAGAGGLGSNCAMNLVRSGFEHFVIADFDTVDHSNLNRQFYFSDQAGFLKVTALKNNLLDINPDLSITVSNEQVSEENTQRIFGDCDCIVEAFDDAKAKKMIIEHFSNSQKLVVAASGIAGCGNTDLIRTRKINSKLYIIGDFVSESSELLPPYSPGVSIAAAKQADVILSHALNKARPSQL